jgi:hypothetical protein
MMSISCNDYLSAAFECEAKARGAIDPKVRLQFEDSAQAYRRMANVMALHKLSSSDLDEIAERMVQGIMEARKRGVMDGSVKLNPVSSAASAVREAPPRLGE